VQGVSDAGAEGYDEEVVVAKGFCQGRVVIIVNFDDGEVVVGGKGSIARLTG
jgi:hypothetical protein